MIRLFLLLSFSIFTFACSANPDHTASCEIKVDGECYQDAKAACAAAGCPDDCTLKESYPAQVQCGSESTDTVGNPDEPVGKPY